MDITQATQLIDGLQDAVMKDPAGAAQKVADLKAQFSELPPDQQQQILQKIEQLRANAANLPPELQQQLGDIVSTVRAAAPR